MASVLRFGSIWITDHYSVPLGRMGSRLQENAEKTTTVFLDILKGPRTIKLFSLAALMGQKLAHATKDEADCQIGLSRRQEEVNAIVGMMNGLSTFGIMIIGALMVQKGLTNWGTVVVVSGLQFARISDRDCRRWR